MMKTQTRPEQLADAYLSIAQANHYMVGLVERVTVDERDEAEQILITWQNAGPQSGAKYRQLNLALDVLDHDRKLARDYQAIADKIARVAARCDV